MRKLISAIVAATIPFAVAVPALAGGSDNGSADMSAVIPESCQLDLQTFVADLGSSVVTGSMFEACNTNRVFQVLASHRALIAGENIQVHFGFDIAELSPDGMSFVAARSGARVGIVPVRIEARDLRKPIALSFSLTAV